MTIRKWSVLLGSAAVLAGCADVEPGEDVATAEQHVIAGDVFGFENPALWSVTGGTKHTLTSATQGTKSLGVSNTYNTQITSATVTGLRGVTSELALDVQLPAAVGWGDVRIIVRAPSAGVYYTDLGGVALTSLTPSAFKTIKFAVPAALQTALRAAPSDLTFQIVVNGPIGATPMAFDNLRFVGAEPTSVVEIRTPLIDDLAYLEVNGVRHRLYWGNSSGDSFRDVTSWFAGGTNKVRLFAMNMGGAQGLDFELRVNGTIVADVECAPNSSACPTVDNGAFVDRVLNVPSLNLPPARTVSVTSPTPGKLYLDDEYTGLTTPATLSLPAGQYKLGLGVSTDHPSNLTGSFYEEHIVVGTSNASVVVGDTPALGEQSVTRIAVLPVRRSRALDSGGLAILTDEQIARVGSQMEATSEKFIRPVSYGLNSWDVTVLPTEENIEIVAQNWDEFPDVACRVIEDPKYANLHSLYDTVIIHNSNYDTARGIEIGRGAGGMGGRCGQFQAHYGQYRSNDTPLPIAIHETLHTYEFYEFHEGHHFTGADGLHGAEVHGFQSTGTQGEEEWLEWYRYFIRGQAAEVSSMRPKQVRLTPVSPADYYVGVFRTARYGLWMAH